VYTQRHLSFLLLTLTALASGCAGPTITSIDLSEHRGAYVVAYLADNTVRGAMERRLVADLAAQEINAWPSLDDIVDITRSSAALVLDDAVRHGAAAVLVLNLVNHDGSGGIVANPQRNSPEHPDLQAMYQYSREHSTIAYDPGHEAIVEVNLFIAGGDSRGELFWSGTIWSFAADGSGAAMRDVSDQVALELAKARERLLGTDVVR
jgi:hypothetical protein